MQGIDLIRKLRLISKIMTLQTGQQVITMHMLSDLARSKVNQKTKICQFEHNMRNIFLEKSCAICGGKASPTPFHKKAKSIRSLNQQFEML